jgi:hypothetical protein
MKRGKLKKGCDHKFIDSNSCLKCGWTPPPIAPAPIAKPVTPFSFRVTLHENTRLREGDVVFHDGAEQVVIQVNASCARIRPVTARMETRKFTPRFSEKPVEFTAPAAVSVTAISANSECDILRRLGKNWREKLNESRA